MSFGQSLGAALLRCAPDLSVANLGVRGTSHEADRAMIRAANSIPAYIELSTHLLIVAPPVKHRETGKLCDFGSWLQHGWCAPSPAVCLAAPTHARQES